MSKKEIIFVISWLIVIIGVGIAAAGASLLFTIVGYVLMGIGLLGWLLFIFWRPPKDK